MRTINDVLLGYTVRVIPTDMDEVDSPDNPIGLAFLSREANELGAPLHTVQVPLHAEQRRMLGHVLLHGLTAQVPGDVVPTGEPQTTTASDVRCKRCGDWPDEQGSHCAYPDIASVSLAAAETAAGNGCALAIERVS